MYRSVVRVGCRGHWALGQDRWHEVPHDDPALVTALLVYRLHHSIHPVPLEVVPAPGLGRTSRPAAPH